MRKIIDKQYSEKKTLALLGGDKRNTAKHFFEGQGSFTTLGNVRKFFYANTNLNLQQIVPARQGDPKSWRFTHSHDQHLNAAVVFKGKNTTLVIHRFACTYSFA